MLKTSEQTNRNLQVLAIVTTIFLPASLIAGIFGMNVKGLPLSEDDAGFLWAMFLLVGASAIVFWWLKRSGILSDRTKPHQVARGVVSPGFALGPIGKVASATEGYRSRVGHQSDDHHESRTIIGGLCDGRKKRNPLRR